MPPTAIVDAQSDDWLTRFLLTTAPILYGQDWAFSVYIIELLLIDDNVVYNMDLLTAALMRRIPGVLLYRPQETYANRRIEWAMLVAVPNGGGLPDLGEWEAWVSISVVRGPKERGPGTGSTDGTEGNQRVA
ncbi:hypothetical protein CERZMDRAFT_99526 [Cercospora zeae-maydis SCOH1-5]|uniref:Uncharacterized protein n=1 Tax=Cercospora zeae-maydis SCOH1-5 TaxID=717836 RepID=A0A6A6FAY4_9PEZI|nr:hypothetical protein CERZMDRAFT_99526 [Cercospora zeae-maydis SCOH1-5]